MTAIELVLAMLLAVVLSGVIVRALPFSLPLPILQIALGGVIAGVLHHGVVLEPAIFFLLFLPPLLFLDGWRIPKDDLFRDRWVILQLALGLVVFTVIGAGYLIHALIPAMPLAVAFALAAIVSPTDPVAVSSIASRAPVPKRLMHILEGESLLNDASGLVCFQFAVAAAVTGTFSMRSASLTFLWVALAGLAAGVAFTLAVTVVQHWWSRRFGEESGSSILISLLIPFGAYLLAEQLQASGILAAVAAGITMSYTDLSGRSMPNTWIERSAVWSTIQFALNGIMFVLLGEQLPNILSAAIAAMANETHHPRWVLAGYAIAIAAALAVLRLIWVWVSLQINLRRQHRSESQVGKVGWRLLCAISLAGVRGAVTLAGILTLPLLLPDGSAFPARDLAIFLAAAVILISLVGASLGLPALLKGLDVPDDSARVQAEDQARAAAARAAVKAVKQAENELLEHADADDPDIAANAASRVIEVYQRRVHDGTQTASDAQRLCKADAAERVLRLAGLGGEREAILALRRQRKIGDETARKLTREIDLLESRYR
ncbi:MAG: Na+/H+ antiporter [Xanthomonadales bacterium]|nr:Na+/H+ antiporter [Xanthomonadales bacterium]